MSQSSAPTKSTEKNPAEQTASMKPVPTAEHRWLQKLIGQWTYETEAVPGQPEMKDSGTERFRQIGEIWVQGEGAGAMPDGTPATTIMTLGFDPAKKRVVGSWVGSMMAWQWVYEGELDIARNELVLSSDGPSFSGEPGLQHYRDTIRFVNDNERTLTASVQGADGSWQTFMQMRYRRK